MATITDGSYVRTKEGIGALISCGYNSKPRLIESTWDGLCGSNIRLALLSEVIYIILKLLSSKVINRRELLTQVK